MKIDNYRVEKSREKVTEILRANGILDSGAVNNFLHPEYSLISGTYILLPGISEAVERIYFYISSSYPIYVYGDFDIDGITATILLCRALEKVGAKSIDYYIPDRVIENHGLNRVAINKIHDRAGNSDRILLITVDCGIQQYTDIEYAKSLGMEVIVTDHHEYEERLLPDCIIVKNAKEFIDTEFSGAGLSFKLAQAILGKKHSDYAEQLLWLAALGTIVDCVPLFGENRIISRLGIDQMNKDRPLAIAALLDQSDPDKGSEQTVITKETVTWVISPRLSSPSRMGNTITQRFLGALEEDAGYINSLAKEIEVINQKRKDLVDRYMDIAVSNNLTNATGNYSTTIFPGNRYDVRGFQGLIASKLKERYNVSSFVFTNCGGILHGSARGSYDCDISEVIRLSLKDNLLIEGGGHKAAGGLVMGINGFSNFCDIIDKVVMDSNIVGDEDYSCYPLETELISNELLVSLKELDPFFEGDTPIFTSQFFYDGERRLIGKGRDHLTFNVRCIFTSKQFKVLGWWKDYLYDDISRLKLGDKIILNYCIFENVWKNVRSIQLEVKKLFID